MVAFHFDIEGELNWAKKLPKNQQFYWLNFLLGLNFGSYGASWFYIPMKHRNTFFMQAFLIKASFVLFIMMTQKTSQKITTIRK